MMKCNTKGCIHQVNMIEMVQPVPYKNQLRDDGYIIWCGAYIKGEDNKYHVFYSRWKKEYGHEGWVSQSEIAHAVSDCIDGEYVFSESVLPERGREYWDGAMTHNPYIIKNNGKYYLYYIGTTAPEHIRSVMMPYSTSWWEFRNRQQIGVAVSDSVYGPWRRYDTPILKPSKKEQCGDTKWDSMAVSNPAIAIDENGKVIMLYKGIQDSTGGDTSQANGPVKFGVAVANQPLGPFTKTDTLIFTNLDDPKDLRMLGEDPFIWYSKKEHKFKAITRDVIGLFTGGGGGLALFESKDGITNWRKSLRPVVLKNRFVWENGTESLDNVERPWLLLDENEIPKMLFGATSLKEKRSESTNVFIPLRSLKHPK